MGNSAFLVSAAHTNWKGLWRKFYSYEQFVQRQDGREGEDIGLRERRAKETGLEESQKPPHRGEGSLPFPGEWMEENILRHNTYEHKASKKQINTNEDVTQCTAFYHQPIHLSHKNSWMPILRTMDLNVMILITQKTDSETFKDNPKATETIGVFWEAFWYLWAIHARLHLPISVSVCLQAGASGASGFSFSSSVSLSFSSCTLFTFCFSSASKD